MPRESFSLLGRGVRMKAHSPGEKYSVDQETHSWYSYFLMTKEQLISLIKKILGADVDLKFLAKLDLAELKILASIIREKIEAERR